jgi:hypothetical protein
MLELRGHHGGTRIILPVVILPPVEAASEHSMAEGRGLFDTGASATAIAPHFVDRLGLKWRGKRQVVTVRGNEFANQYRFRFGFLQEPLGGAASGSPFLLESDLYGIDFTPTGAFDVLIGMDVIRQGETLLRKDGTYSFRI